MGWLDNVLNVNRIQQRGNGEVSRVAFTGGSDVNTAKSNGLYDGELDTTNGTGTYSSAEVGTKFDSNKWIMGYGK